MEYKIEILHGEACTISSYQCDTCEKRNSEPMPPKKQQEAKQKAEELVKKMYLVQSNSAGAWTMYIAKQCALICVTELIEEKMAFEPYGSRIEWFESVKKEIEKL